MSLKNGLYKISFSLPTRGRANGIVILVGGKLVGGDSMFAYTGTYMLDQDMFSARIEIRPHSEGRIGLRRMLNSSRAIIEVAGEIDDDGGSGTGSCNQLSGENISVRLEHIAKL